MAGGGFGGGSVGSFGGGFGSFGDDGNVNGGGRGGAREEEVDFTETAGLGGLFEGADLDDDGPGEKFGIVCIGRSASICGGPVGAPGSEARICLKDPDECTTASHRPRHEEDVALVTESYAVQAKPTAGAKAAYLAPVIPAARDSPPQRFYGYSDI